MVTRAAYPEPASSTRYDGVIDAPRTPEFPTPPEPGGRPNAARALLIGVGIVLAFVAAQVFASIVAAQFGLRVDLKSIDLRSAVALCVTELLTLVVAVSLVPWVGGAVRVAWRDRRARAGAGALALLPVGIVVVGFSLAASIGHDPLVAPRLDLPTGAALVIAAVLIAVTEELWFRGLLIAGLGGARRPWLSVCGSALLFGLPHLDGSRASVLNAGGVVLAVGIPFAVVRLRMYALLPLILWHAIIDSWAFLHTADVQATGTPSNAEIIGGLVLPALLAAGYLTWFTRSGSRRASPAAGR